MWEVVKGYGDAVNPVNWAKGLMHVANTTAQEGIGAGASELGRGIWHTLTAWLTTDDPREFGQSFGGTLLTVAPLLKGVPLRLMPKSIVIGEGMARVSRVARLIGAETFEPGLPKGVRIPNRQLWEMNKQWLAGKYSQGYKVIDIGRRFDGLRGKSRWYKAEKMLLKRLRNGGNS